MKNCKKYEQFIKRLIFNELNETEKAALDEHLQQCPRCRKLLEYHSSLQDISKWEAAAMPEEFYFTKMRQNVLREITVSRQKSFLEKLFKHLFQRTVVKLSPALTFASLVLIFFSGYYAHSWIKKDHAPETLPRLAAIRRVALQNQSLLDVEKSPYLFTDVRIKKTNQGKIELTFNVTTEAHYTGEPSDPLVKEILSQALINQTNDGYRLVAVDISGKIIDSRIKEALIYSMLHDENTAVRIKALRVLAKLKMDSQLREAFIRVLQTEKNVNMRLQALDILAKNNSGVKNIIPILKEKIERDDNPSVQWKAATYLQKIERVK